MAWASSNSDNRKGSKQPRQWTKGRSIYPADTQYVPMPIGLTISWQCYRPILQIGWCPDKNIIILT